MSTTEETNAIAAAVQCGKADVLALWEATRRFAMKMALRWFRALEWRGDLTTDDLAQVSFLALLDALDRWRAGAGQSFLGIYALCLRAAFSDAYGLRTQRDKRDPIEWAQSLDAQLVDREGDPFLLADIVPDPAAEAAIAEVAERDRLQRLHDMLESALSTLPPEQADALRNRFYFGREADIAACNKGLRALRHPRISQNLRRFYDSSD